MIIKTIPDYFELAFRGEKPRKAFITAILTYLVPYCVTTWEQY